MREGEEGRTVFFIMILPGKEKKRTAEYPTNKRWYTNNLYQKCSRIGANRQKNSYNNEGQTIHFPFFPFKIFAREKKTGIFFIFIFFSPLAVFCGNCYYTKCFLSYFIKNYIVGKTMI